MREIPQGAPKYLWAIYKDGEKVNTREGYERGDARVAAVNCRTSMPDAAWALGAYTVEGGTAPRHLADCPKSESI